MSRSGVPGPLSLAQERFWFMDRLLAGIPLFNNTYAWRLSGPLDVDALARSLDRVVARHQILRTSFPVVDGQPVQRVDPDWRPELEVGDLTGDPGDADARVDAWLRRAAGRAFDLGTEPGIRTALARLGPDDHALALVCHHIAFDGWSKGVVAGDLAHAYGSIREGSGGDLPPLPLQYAEYAADQRAWLAGEAAAQHRAYWSSRLADAPVVLDLPGDRPRPASPSYAGDRVLRTLSPESRGAAESLAREEKATPFMVFLAVFLALVRRYTGREDFLVGVPVAVRQGRKELTDMVGCFMNMIVIRADVSGDPTFRELLRRTRQAAFEAYPHQDLPFEEVVELVDPERSLNRNPLFQILFNYRSYPGVPLELPGVECREIAFHPGFSTLDLSLALHAYRPGNHLDYEIEYSSEQFDASTMVRLASHYERLVEDAIGGPDRTVSELTLMGEEERRRVVVEWNVTAESPAGRPVFEGILDRARERPEAPAIEQGERVIRYEELAARAGRVAAGLRNRGIGPGAVVGLFFDRSPELFGAMQGVLSAGAAYLPLDAATPDEWLSTLARDAEAGLVVADPVLGLRAGALGAPAWVSLEALEREGGEERPTTDPAAPEDLAYVIYTSGSTGNPKGVEIPRAALSRFVELSADRMDLTAEDRVTQFSSIGFDLSGMEIHPTLARGATLVLRAPGAAPSASEFTRWLDDAGITVAILPTGYWHMWAADVGRGGNGLPASLRLVLVIGEKALAGPYAAWRARVGPSIRWINAYGPTEATIAATAYEPDPGVAWDPSREIPIGRPLPGYTAYVLDEGKRPAPIGVPGELYLGGLCLARGYRNDAAKTAERFVPDPFGSGGRLYRTGDRARWRSDGELEFVGRVDDQVKIRGHRVEPGQVEAVLSGHPAVAACAVVAREVGGEKTLVAYAAPRPGQELAVSAARAFLAQRLPDAMVPGSFVVLAEMPLNANGKIDRGALPAPDPALGESYVAPRSETEQVLARIWGESLELSRVGIRDDFFDLGGHSLIAAKLLSDAERALGASIPLSWIFEYPTIERLALALEERDAPPEGEFLVPIRGSGDRTPLFCVHGGGGGIFVYRSVTELLDPRQPVFGLMLLGRAGDDPPRSVEEMAARYLEEVRTVQSEGPYRLAGYSFGALVAYEMACRLDEGGEVVELLALLDARSEFSGMLSASERWRRKASGIPDFGRRTLRRFRESPVADWPEMTRETLQRATGSWTGPARGGAAPPPGSQASVAAIAAAATRAYRPRPYAGRVVYFRASEEVGGGEGRVWERLAQGGVEIRTIPGRHLTIMTPENAPLLARELQDCLDRLEAALSSPAPSG